MSSSVLCFCCHELLSERVRKCVEARKTSEFQFMPNLELFKRLFPHPNKPNECVLNECCVGYLMTSIDNSSKINSYNPQKSIVPYIRTAKTMLPSVVNITEKQEEKISVGKRKFDLNGF
jgi:hypothetical protein